MTDFDEIYTLLDALFREAEQTAVNSYTERRDGRLVFNDEVWADAEPEMFPTYKQAREALCLKPLDYSGEEYPEGRPPKTFNEMCEAAIKEGG